jgi:hypothetical protein
MQTRPQPKTDPSEQRQSLYAWQYNGQSDAPPKQAKCLVLIEDFSGIQLEMAEWDGQRFLNQEYCEINAFVKGWILDEHLISYMEAQIALQNLARMPDLQA